MYDHRRAKLYRYNNDDNSWKERGTGEVRLLEHKETKKVRVVMRRDKTLKVCANHYITKDMKLSPNVSSDRSWVYNVAADISDGEATAETLAIRFANAESTCPRVINGELLRFATNVNLNSQTRNSTRRPSRQPRKEREPSSRQKRTTGTPRARSAVAVRSRLIRPRQMQQQLL